MTRSEVWARRGTRSVRRMAPGMTAVVILALAATADAATITVSNTNSSGSGSLAQAITTANATVTADVINFSLLGLGAQTITGPFPAITQPLTINGYSVLFSSVSSRTDETSNANIIIELDGAEASGASVLTILSNDVTIRGLAIRGIASNSRGILVAEGRTNVSILGCFIGTNAAGTADDSAGVGISVEGAARIGSALPADRNLISGNSTGIELHGSSSIVENNLIGLNSDGELGIGNLYGIRLSNDASNNTIGTVSATNIIAANLADGIELANDAGDGNRLFYNRFHDNDELGIDLGADGPTFNDEDDSDAGPNNLLNTPELNFVRINHDLLKVRGTIRSNPGEYRVHVFGAVAPNSRGFGEGARRYGGTNATVFAGQTTRTFFITIDAIDETDPPFISAVLEEVATGNSSEFSRPLEALHAGSEFVVTNTSDEYIIGSLRAGISLATEGNEGNTIVFNIPGDGPHTFVAATPYFVNGGGTVIFDGYSQPGSEPNTAFEGSNAIPKIILKNGTAGAEAVVKFESADATLQGLVIQSGTGEGVRIQNSSARLLGNFIGTDATGTVDLGSDDAGVRITGTEEVMVGGPSPAHRNVISGNDGGGVVDSGIATTVVNNLIGYSSDLDPLGNSVRGVYAKGHLVVGGDDPDLENRIGYNAGPGVEVDGATSRVSVLGNSIVDNEGLGIDLWAEGEPDGAVTPNDVDDADVGANKLQNFPVISTVEVSPESFMIEGTLDLAVQVDPVLTLRVYASTECDPSGFGEGERFLAAFQRDFSNTESFELTVPAALAPGEKVTMTATTSLGETSEFSACFGIPGGVICGDASEDEDVSATDALLVLRTAVGTRTCDLCLCDVNGNGAVSSSDALLVLREAVGQSVTFNCPAC
jgi:hypothetical protein